MAADLIQMPGLESAAYYGGALAGLIRALVRYTDNTSTGTAVTSRAHVPGAPGTN
jgi:hypothetical protein